jgi:DNA-binding CsgD family transcriptional regulator
MPGLLASVLDAADLGVAILDGECGLHYANPVARRLLAIDKSIPEGVKYQLRPMLAELIDSQRTSLERWILGPLALRARLRRVVEGGEIFVLELSVTRIAGAGDVIEALARWLGLTRDESVLLTMLWRGYSNDEMARRLDVAIGTVKSRLYRLYQTLGVSNRIGAALVAADVLGPR